MSNHVVWRNPERLQAALVERLGRFDVATLHEAMNRRGLLEPSIRPIYPGAKLAGTAITVLMPPGDNWMLHVAVEVCRPGDVVVAVPTSPCSDGYFGELLATSMRAHGVLGLIIDAGCRDVQALRSMGFPVWSKAIHAQGTVKASLGSVNVPVVCAGALVNPGDAIIADDDGVVVVPKNRAADVLTLAGERVEREKVTRARLAAGELGLDIYQMRDKLAALGLRYS